MRGRKTVGTHGKLPHCPKSKVWGCEKDSLGVMRKLDDGLPDLLITWFGIFLAGLMLRSVVTSFNRIDLKLHCWR